MKSIWTAGLWDFNVEIIDRINNATANSRETWDYEDAVEYFINCSEAFSLLAAGQVTVVLSSSPDGNFVFPRSSYWTNFEWPILSDPGQNPAVTKVFGLRGSLTGYLPHGKAEELFPGPASVSFSPP